MSENVTQPSAQPIWQPAFGIPPAANTGTNNIELPQMGSVPSGGDALNEQFGNPFGIVKQEPGPSPFHGGPLQHDPRFSSSNSSAHTDGNYSTQPSFPPSMMQPSGGTEKSMDQSQGNPAQQSTFDPFATQQAQPKIGGDIDSALSNLAENLTISGSNQGRPVQWTGPQQQGQPQVPVSSSMPAPTVAPQMPSYGAPPQYTTPYGQYPQTYGGQMPQWQMQHPQMFAAPQQAPAPGYMYGGTAMGYGQMPSQPHPQQGQDPFGGF
ncbi:hypothetical protein OESDEN_01109 [Oesophagostomum dentatum]|uniref:Uncharacterized protein n=1 Tax=Oesophagostomum dentatum TaxID=61180 RepID=A0A0B1TTX6_OESDE|nr:hypothetical protein OESDEN_01109 [Oesophagostomum dentatum]